MCNIIDHPFFQEYNLQEIDIISLKNLSETGVHIHMPRGPINSDWIELELSFKNNVNNSLTLFDRIFVNKYGFSEAGNLERHVTFNNEPDYFAFMKELSKILLLGYYAKGCENTNGDNPIEPEGEKVPAPVGPIPLSRKDAKSNEKPINVDNGKGNTIIAISVNKEFLKIEEVPNTTSCYRAFIEYCIDNHAASIQKSESMQSLIKADKNDPKLINDIKWDRVKERGGWYYSTHASSLIKKDRMIKIANELGLHVEFMAVGDSEIQEIPGNLDDFKNQVRQFRTAPGIESEMMIRVENCINNDGDVFDDIIRNNLHNNKPWMRIAAIKIPMILKVTFFDNIGDYHFDYRSAVMASAISQAAFEYISSAIETRFSQAFKNQFIKDVLKLKGV